MDEWYAMFGHALLANSAMDRPRHLCNGVKHDGHSYRKPPSKARAKTA